jgi:hypothetical protein
MNRSSRHSSNNLTLAIESNATDLIGDICREAKLCGRGSSPILVGMCHEALRRFPKEAASSGLLQPLWTPHYDHLRNTEAALAEAAEAAARCPGTDQEQRLAAARGEFAAAAHAAKRHLIQLQGIVAAKGNTSYGRQLLYKLQVFTGDVERYEERNSPTAARPLLSSEHSDMTALSGLMSGRTYAKCIGTYRAACRLLPQNGLAYNQLAVVFEAKGDPFFAAYYYTRAFFAEHKPFEKSPENLARVLLRSRADRVVDDAVQRLFFACQDTLQQTMTQNTAALAASLRAPCLKQAVWDYLTNTGGVFNPADMVLERLVALLIASAVCAAASTDAPLLALMALTARAARFAAKHASAAGRVPLTEGPCGSALAAAELCLRWLVYNATVVDRLVARACVDAQELRGARQICCLLLQAMIDLRDVLSRLSFADEGAVDASVTLPEDLELLGLRSYNSPLEGSSSTEVWGRHTTSLSVAMSQNPMILGRTDTTGVPADVALQVRLLRLKRHLASAAATNWVTKIVPLQVDEEIFSEEALDNAQVAGDSNAQAASDGDFEDDVVVYKHDGQEHGTW